MAFNYWQKFEEGGFYHIYNRATLDLKLFKENEDYEDFLSKFRKYFEPYLDTVAYCLIPNHFHFLCKVKSLEEVNTSLKKEETKAAQLVLKEEKPFNDFLEDQARRFFSAYSLKHKNKYHRRGNLFTEKFKRVRVTNGAKLLYLLCYIHHNPIHHHFELDYSDWPYSSYNFYLTKACLPDRQVDSFLKKDEIIDWLGGLSIFLQHHRDFKIDNEELLNFD